MIIRTSYAGWSFIGRVPHVGRRCLVLVRLYYLEGLTHGTCYFSGRVLASTIGWKENQTKDECHKTCKAVNERIPNIDKTRQT